MTEITCNDCDKKATYQAWEVPLDLIFNWTFYFCDEHIKNWHGYKERIKKGEE